MSEFIQRELIMAEAEERGDFVVRSGMWGREDEQRAQFQELNVTWYWSTMEGHGEIADHDCGPDCPCYKPG